mmetsp:Transcript_9537/g.18596  ORF Transcript_9537/g.18596 Transcript_9537/m.18596 type:complete len:86 (-) Transcript_9537:125-382(-)
MSFDVMSMLCEYLRFNAGVRPGPSSPKNNHQPTNETKSTRKNAKNKIQEQKRKTMSITIEHPLSCRGHVTNRELLSASTVGMTTG